MGTLDAVALREFSTILTAGLVVGVGTQEEVLVARRAVADCENVMLIQAGDGPIPWQAAFFTRIYAEAPKLLDPELLRLLAPGGRTIEIPTESC